MRWPWSRNEKATGPPVEPDEPGTCTCSSRDAQRAHWAIVRGELVERLTDESHLGVNLRRCPACGRLFVTVFTEVVDWQDGDDSQSLIAVPVTPEEADHLRSLPQPLGESQLETIGPRQMLHWDHPRGGKPSYRWFHGPLWIPPHD